jgi:hypothetical protein
VNKIKIKIERYLGRYYPPATITNVVLMLIISMAFTLIFSILPIIFSPTQFKYYFTTSPGLTALAFTFGISLLRVFVSLALYKGSTIAYYLIFIFTTIALLGSFRSGFAGINSLMNILFNGLIIYNLYQPVSRKYCSIKI